MRIMIKKAPVIKTKSAATASVAAVRCFAVFLPVIRVTKDSPPILLEAAGPVEIRSSVNCIPEKHLKCI